MDRKTGRTFDDSDDEEYKLERHQVRILLDKFDNVEFVLENAALTSALFSYMFEKSYDYFSLLYVYVFRKYLRVNDTKNSMRNYNHINMEIYTTFIHPESILQIHFDNKEMISQIEENLDSENCIIYFNKVAEFLVHEVLTKYLLHFREMIQLGLENYSYTNKIHEEMNRTQELKILESLHSNIHNSLIRNQKTRCMPPPRLNTKNPKILYDFQIRAIAIALNTQLEYFVSSKKYSYTLKHPENFIQTKTFLSTPPVKSTNKQRIKGHCFDEHSLPRVALCLVCELILWGPHPSCLYCQNCKKSIHRDCKENVKYCLYDVKSSRKNELIEAELKTIKTRSDSVSIISDTVTQSSETRNQYPIQDQIFFNSENDESQIMKRNDKQRLFRKTSISKLPEWKSPFGSDKSKKRGVKYTKSMNSTNNIKPYECDSVTRSESARSRSPENNIPQSTYRFNKRSTSEDSILTDSVEPPPISMIEMDEEMNVLETFEPDKELEMFSNAFKKSSPNDKDQYQRLLVLMEFHHKTRFIRMTLKRIKYVLVDPWVTMNDYMELFDSLSLNCIEKLYKLIGSLVDVIDRCKGDSSYDTSMAQNVLNWLTDDDESNLQRWLQLSTDLCCTNILHSVKASWIEHKQISSRLNGLFSIAINRLLVIDQLSNMRSLLFNLPMIVTKIVKDLKRFSMFKDEARIWERVRHKLSHLPQIIDERCMPVVHLINNGTIVNSSLKFKRYKNGTDYDKDVEVYVNNFPRMIFKNNFIDFQFVKISNLREYRQGVLKPMTNSVYVRDEVDSAVICYDREIIILQKENERYLLKQFKSPGANKLFPVITLDQIHATKQNGKENKEFQHELTIVLKNQAILAQILFKTENSRDMWFDHIIKMSDKVPKEKNSKVYSATPPVRPASPDNFDAESEHSVDSTESNSVPISIRMATLKTSFNDSVNQLLTTFNIISSELSTDGDNDIVLKRIIENGPNSPSEFMFGYMNVLKEYASLGYQMMDQSQSIDSSLLLQKDIIKMSTPKLKIITDQITALLQSQEQDMVESESSDESTLEDDNRGANTKDPFDIEVFVGEIINESLNQVDNDSGKDN